MARNIGSQDILQNAPRLGSAGARATRLLRAHEVAQGVEGGGALRAMG